MYPFQKQLVEKLIAQNVIFLFCNGVIANAVS